MYELVSTPTFDETYKKLVKGDTLSEKRIIKTFKLMRSDPFYPSLKSHKVNTRNFGLKWSSWITGDVRIIWDFDQQKKQILLLFALTRHSGSHREYK